MSLWSWALPGLPAPDTGSLGVCIPAGGHRAAPMWLFISADGIEHLQCAKQLMGTLGTLPSSDQATSSVGRAANFQRDLWKCCVLPKSRCTWVGPFLVKILGL